MKVKCPFCPRMNYGDDQPVTYNQKELMEHMSSHTNDHHFELEAIRLHLAREVGGMIKRGEHERARKQLLARVAGNVAAGSAIQLGRDLRLGIVTDSFDEVGRISDIATQIAESILRKTGL